MCKPGADLEGVESVLQHSQNLQNKNLNIDRIVIDRIIINEHD